MSDPTKAQKAKARELMTWWAPGSGSYDRDTKAIAQALADRSSVRNSNGYDLWAIAMQIRARGEK